MTWLRSGQVAAAAGINPQTLRYYQRRVLLAEPDRSLGGHRLYLAETVTVLRGIKAAQRLGFTRPALATRAARSRLQGSRSSLASRMDRHFARVAKASSSSRPRSRSPSDWTQYSIAILRQSSAAVAVTDIAKGTGPSWFRRSRRAWHKSGCSRWRSWRHRLLSAGVAWISRVRASDWAGSSW